MIGRAINRLRTEYPGVSCIVIFTVIMLSVRLAATLLSDGDEWLGTVAAVAGLLALAFVVERRST